MDHLNFFRTILLKLMKVSALLFIVFFVSFQTCNAEVANSQGATNLGATQTPSNQSGYEYKNSNRPDPFKPFIAKQTLDPNELVDDSDSELVSKDEDKNSDYWYYITFPLIDVDISKLKSKNSDTVGWIKVDGTKVNYPIVQAEDNDYYLSHAFNKRSNAGGWVFADYRVDFKDFGRNTIIYGHNMNNKTMFGSIPNMLYSGYLNNSNNYYIKISTPTSNRVWKVFSIYNVDPQTYYLKTNFNIIFKKTICYLVLLWHFYILLHLVLFRAILFDFP